ncbi:MAG: GNAT family N-acetyltransferase, partial [Pseudonocardiaceae bacterium]
MTLALTWLAAPPDGQVAAIAALLGTAAAVDGVDPLSEAAALRLHHPGVGFLHLLAHDSPGPLVGYGSLAEREERRTAEFAVHPECRRRGVGGALLAALLDRVRAPLWL